MISSALLREKQGDILHDHPEPAPIQVVSLSFSSHPSLRAWYLRYALSYHDLEEIMRERGLQVDYTTISRWVQHYAPELERRCRSHWK